MRNYGIRYPSGEDGIAYSFKNNYGAWIPETELKVFIDKDTNDGSRGHHTHEFIPKDYVPKVKR